MKYIENPFFILDVTLSDQKGTIAAHADERALFSEDESCEEAGRILLNPSRRLHAELHWFPEENPAVVEGVRKHIEGVRGNAQDNGLPLGEYKLLTRLNDAVYCLECNPSISVQALKKAVMNIATLYATLDAENVCDDIRSCQVACVNRSRSDHPIGYQQVKVTAN